MSETTTEHNHAHEASRQFFLPDQVVILAEFDSDKGLKIWFDRLENTFDQYHIASKWAYRIDEKTIIVVLHIEAHEGDSTERVIDAVNTLNKTVVPNAKVAASPNWLYGSAPHGITEGGPGGEPKPVDDADKHKRYFKKTKVRQLVREVCGNSKSTKDEDDPAQQPVNVVILDTAPIDAYKTYAENELLNELRPVLTVHRALSTVVPLPTNPPPAATSSGYWLTKRYQMTDHGLFIAGTVHTWAEEAKLHIVEVLNNYGVGSLEGLIAAFHWIRHNPSIISPEYPLVINCSICLCLPVLLTDEGPRFNLRLSEEPSAEERLIVKWANSQSPQLVEAMMGILQRAIQATQSAFQEKGIRVIAAAGNDGIEGEPVPDTRYPAAYPCVVGVGSVEANGNRAWYSNKADFLPQDGLMAFGGKAQRAGGRNHTTDKEGILGIYLDGFPDANGEPTVANPNGWAWWSGTSFATGVVSGIFAYAAAQCCDISCTDEANDFKHKLKDKKDAHTDIAEPILKTAQGPK